MGLSNLGMSMDATALPTLGDGFHFPLTQVSSVWAPCHTHMPPLAAGPVKRRGLGEQDEEPLWDGLPLLGPPGNRMALGSRGGGGCPSS